MQNMFEHENIPNCFYRVSVKALILDSEGRFLLCKEESGLWDFPGGGLDFGESPAEGLVREVKEEMGLVVTSVGDFPLYFITGRSPNSGRWVVNVFYLTTVADMVITPSSECVETRFFTKEEALKENVYMTVKKFAGQYSFERHINEKSPKGV